jgi:hypothetical protein
MFQAGEPFQQSSCSVTSISFDPPGIIRCARLQGLMLNFPKHTNGIIDGPAAAAIRLGMKRMSLSGEKAERCSFELKPTFRHVPIISRRTLRHNSSEAKA